VDAAPYFRVFNPLTQGEKFDPQAFYIKQFVPELAGVPAKDIHTLNRLPSNYPKPIVDLKASREEALSRYKLLEGDTTPPVYPSLQNTLF
jgi:deoxyribodipyrimidine photo-lyase